MVDFEIRDTYTDGHRYQYVDMHMIADTETSTAQDIGTMHSGSLFRTLLTRVPTL